jgi:hypothetical protein
MRKCLVFGVEDLDRRGRRGDANQSMETVGSTREHNPRAGLDRRYRHAYELANPGTVDVVNLRQIDDDSTAVEQHTLECGQKELSALAQLDQAFNAKHDHLIHNFRCGVLFDDHGKLAN